MSRTKRTILNSLIAEMPERIVLTSAWLKTHHVSNKLAWWYVKSHWLEKIGKGAFKKPGQPIHWLGGLAALQSQLYLSIHIGAKTSLELLGQAHYIPMLGGTKNPILFNRSDEKVPQWFRNNKAWDANCLIYKSSLFQEVEPPLGIISKSIEGINVSLSTPERAALEVLYLTPSHQNFEEAYQLIEGMSQLRPSLVQELLESCNSIKVKRLFLYLADKFQHPWVARVDTSKINLGYGKRVIANGGHYDSKYQLSVPEFPEE